MGHVPPRQVPLVGEGPHVPRRQYRGSRPTGPPDLGAPPGPAGEALAARFLRSRGLHILATNLRVGRGEIDIVARDLSSLVVVEVRTLTGSSHPLDAIDPAKRARVRKLGRAIGIHRCDFVGVGLYPSHIVIHWAPDSA